MNRSEYLHVRIAPDVKAKLKELADAEGRTVSNYIVYLISREIQKSQNN